MLDVAQGKAATHINLPKIAGWLFAILVFQGVVSYFRSLMFSQVSEKGTSDIRAALDKQWISLPIFVFEHTLSVELCVRLTDEWDSRYWDF